jgi:hypothetical protein
VTTPNEPPPTGLYRKAGERPPQIEDEFVVPKHTWVKPVLIAMALALGVPAVMLCALFILLIGICSHGR